ncbi:MAG: hypothetical protein IT350_14440 [Deltaproteobacteria bacterium]|nr:hypothetical protein [Deltaproteobacteria bacterium]
MFPAKSIPCTVFLDGGEAQLDCPLGPPVALAWTWPDGRFPFDDGDVVRLYMEYGAYDPPTYSMAVFGLDESLLVLATPDYHLFSSPKIDCRDVDADVETDYACEYQIADAPPRNWPEDDGVNDWTRVFGHSVSGQFMDLAWTLENPAEVAATEDGGYLAIAPVAYMGTFFADDDIVDKGDVGRHEFRLQLVRRWD